MNFNRLKKLHVSPERTSLFTFWAIEGAPALRVRPANQSNPDYIAALLKEARGQIRQAASAGNSAEVLRLNREVDRKLYPLHVVVGWPTAPLQDDGKPAEWSQQSCADFLKAIPDDMMDDLRNHCASSSNFRGPEPEEVKDAQGN
jgi:hypothetical protein